MKKYIIGYKNSSGNRYFDVYVQEMNGYEYVYRDRINVDEIDTILEKLKRMYSNNQVCFFKIY